METNYAYCTNLFVTPSYQLRVRYSNLNEQLSHFISYSTYPLDFDRLPLPLLNQLSPAHFLLPLTNSLGGVRDVSNINIVILAQREVYYYEREDRS